MPLNWQKNWTKYSFVLTILILPIIAIAQTNPVGGDSVLELNQKIAESKTKAQELQKKMDAYGQKIRETQKKASTLQNQINILDAGVEKTELGIQNKLLEIQQMNLELELIKEKIIEENGRLEDNKGNLGELLRQIRRYDRQGYLAILVGQNTFSELYDELHRGEILTGNLAGQVQMLKQIKDTLEGNQGLLDAKKQEAEKTKEQLDETKITLEEEKELKERLFGKTKATEGSFQSLLTELRQEEAAIDAEIFTLEKNVRQKLQIVEDMPGAQGKLSWPVNPVRGITATFHDPEYPFRYIFEHTGVDIRVSQGTPIAAAASGYVAKAFNGGLGNKPSYIMLIHANGLATVYMHVSSINVLADTYVTRGQIIGASGGKPGTSGAGRWTTGPHLHFEARLNGVPVDPLGGYLP